MFLFKRTYFCSDEINKENPELILPKLASYIDATTDCAKRTSKIASISEMRKYWNYIDIHFPHDQICRNNFWTSNKVMNKTHLRVVLNIVIAFDS